MSGVDGPYDIVGVGIGPFNLALAALAEPTGLDVLFFDERPVFSWHPGLLIDGTTLQVPFLADLVTLVDPTSRWSFLAYLRAQQRLFPFYFAERFHVPRKEYDHYCRWVAESLPYCHFGARVNRLGWVPDHGCFRVDVVAPPGDRRRSVLARNVVLGVGTTPTVPAAFRGLLGKRVFHVGQYLDQRPALAGATDVTVVGSGQSGAEVFADLLRAQPDAGWRLRWLTRTPAFVPMEYSKLGLEHFTPDYVGYFRSLTQPVRDRLVPAQWQLYKGISASTIADIYDLLYERSIGGGAAAAALLPCVEVTGVRHSAGGYELCCRQTQQERDFSVRTDAVVLATGYAARRPEFLSGLTGLIDWDAQGRYRVSADYRVALTAPTPGGLYVQNAELHTHGVGAPDLGLGAWRAATILNAITGCRAYDLPSSTAFTTFGVA